MTLLFGLVSFKKIFTENIVGFEGQGKMRTVAKGLIANSKVGIMSSDYTC